MELFAYRRICLALFEGAILAGLLGTVVTASNCSVDPLVLPITNVTFPDGIAVNRGIRIVLGGQVQGLRMSTTLNNTRVRNVLDCPANGSGLAGCEGASGSVYSTTSRSFRQVYNLKDWNVTVVDPRPNSGTTVLQGFDVANFTDAPAVVPDFPFEVWANHDALNKSALALGPKSSVLDQIVANNLAPSSAFSIDYGSRSELYPRDGQLVIGGSNAGRHDRTSKYPVPMWAYGAPIPCPLQVLVKNVILSNADGDHSLFEDPGTSITTCIDTIQNAFTFTPFMYQRWKNLTKWVASDSNGNYTPQIYPADREPLIGTLTIVMTTGYTTIIPHHELVTHERGTDAQGKYAVVNNSRIMAAVQTGPSDLGDNIPILGGVFLSQNYLHVDYDASAFWLSPQIGNGTFKDDVVSSCVPSNTTADDADSSPRGNSILGLEIGLPVAFVVVALGLVAYFMIRRNRLKSEKEKKYATVDVRDYGNEPMEQVSTVGAGGRALELPADAPDLRRMSEIQGNQLPLHKGDAIVSADPLSPATELERTETYEVHGASVTTSPRP